MMLDKTATPTCLPLKVIRQLDLHTPVSLGRAAHLSAASGLVAVGDYFYVVADDEYQLGIFSRRQHQQPGELLSLFAGVLPDEAKARKAQKPDLEALVQLPAFAGYPQGALLAIGSGSKANRQRAVVLPLNAQAQVTGVSQILDLSALYVALQASFVDLNIEGAVVTAEHLYLLQRGNKGEGTFSAIIEVKLAAVLEAINTSGVIPASALGAIRRCDIGEVNGTPLSFTDAALLPDGSWVFTAAAEATADSYNDGEVVGVAIGVLNAHGQVVRLYPLAAVYKMEGIAAEVQGDTVQLWLVTDADDPATAAVLLAAQLQGYPFS